MSALAGAPGAAYAEDPSPTQDPQAPAEAKAASDETAEHARATDAADDTSADHTSAATAATETTEARGDPAAPLDLSGEVIAVWGERPDKPFDRDTALRLSGEELVHRGATNLAEALELLPDLHVRQAGRGGRQVDIRGARKGSIKILIDGIAVDDPFYGNFDISSIPVTDIVQIRVSTAPSSPIDGAGGPGGVIEVHTRDAVGARRLEAQVRGSSLPDGLLSATGRSMLSAHWAARVSATAELGSQDFAMRMGEDPSAETFTLDEDRRQTAGALRLEYRRGHRRVVADAWVQQRSFVVPPGEEYLSDVLVIDGEMAARAGVIADDRVGPWQLQARGYAHALQRDSIGYTDATLTDMARAEDLSAVRTGAGFLATRPFGKSLRAVASSSLDVDTADVDGFDGRPAGGMATLGELAAGLQYEEYPVRIDAAVGLAVPIGVGAAPWPEAKLAASWKPVRPVELAVTLARKGRLPTLRERFRGDVGNADLGPEQAYFGEVAVTLRPTRAIAVTMASYWRETDGLIRLGGATGTLINLGALSIRGVDARLSVTPHPALTVGLDGAFTDAYSSEAGTQPLDFLPIYRAGAFATVTRQRFGGTLQLRAIGERIDQNEALPAYQLVDVSAHAHLGGGLLGQLRVANALAQDYLLRRGGVLGTGRVVTLSLQGVWE